MGKVSLIARIEVKPEKADDFAGAWDSMFEHIAANEPGTEHYVLHRVKEKPNIFYVSEVYKDQAAFDAHAGSDAFAGLLGSLGDFVVNAEMDVSEPLKSAKG